jgi:hypothetical protein
MGRPIFQGGVRMFTKLLKYEYKATAKILLPIYAVYVLLLLLVRLGIFLCEKEYLGFSNIGNVMSSLSNTSTSVIGFLFLAMAVITFAVVAWGFYKAMLDEETHTNVHSIILSGYITAISWFALLAVLSAFLFFSIGSNRYALTVLTTSFDFNWNNNITWLLFALFTELSYQIMSAFFSVSMGQFTAKYKILTSIIVFILIQFVISNALSVIFGVCILITGNIVLCIALTIPISVILFAVFYFCTVMLIKKLNNK